MIHLFHFLLPLFLFKPAEEEKSPWDLPYQCNEMKVVYKDVGEPKFKQIRKNFTKKDKKRVRKLARMVAHEMGADPRPLLIIMDRGASSNPYSIHIKNPDINADQKSYYKHKWTKFRESQYQKILDERTPLSKEYWEAKAGLSRIQIYKDNVYYNENMVYDVVLPDGSTIQEQRPWFALKYGPLDMSAVGYTKVWSNEAPPWIMCNYDGIIAYVVGIWSLREYANDCKEQMVNGDSIGVVDRRYARGKCMKPSKAYIKRAEAYGMNPDKPINLGKKWKEENTNRHEILNHMIEKAREKNLIE